MALSGETVRDREIWRPSPLRRRVTFERPDLCNAVFKKSDGRLSVLCLCDEHFRDFSFVIHSSPEATQFAVDPAEDLVEMLLPLR